MDKYLTDKMRLLVEMYLLEFKEDGVDVVTKRNYSRSTRMLKSGDPRYVALQLAIAIHTFEGRV